MVGLGDRFARIRNEMIALIGVKYVRGGEIFEVRDEHNVVLNDPTRY